MRWLPRLGLLDRLADGLIRHELGATRLVVDSADGKLLDSSLLELALIGRFAPRTAIVDGELGGRLMIDLRREAP